MKITSKWFAVGGLVGSLLVASAMAGDPVGLYFKADAGGNWTDGTELREFFGPVTPGSKVEFDAGPRFGLAVGYDVLDFLGLEAQIGVYENEISSITEATSLHAWLVNVPFMANARLHLPTYYRVSPYIGAGVGGSSTILDADHITVNDTTLTGTDGDTVFAWQAFAGVRFSLTQHMGLSVEYRYFESDPARWKADFAFGTATDTVSFGKIQTHSVSVAFDWTF
jgi:opacity protein-like surface antigen